MMAEQTDTMNASRSRPWHALEPAAICAELQCAQAGLTTSEASQRLERFGRNAIPRRKPPGIAQILLRQCKNPIIYILIVAAVVSLAIGHATDAGFIAAVVVLNALIGGFQEHRAEKSARALQGLLKTIAVVERDGETMEIDAEQIVPGDVIVLESGNRVPADARLLTSTGLEIDESLMTGESVAAEKDAHWIGAVPTPLAERRNMAFAGSMVVHGRAKAVVVETGANTQVGGLAMDVLTSVGGEVPLLLRLHRFSRAVGAAVLIAAVAISVIGVVTGRYTVPEMFMFAVALAVSAIPEGLPVAITVALSVAANRMARRGVIVRKLGAVEGLGSCTFIASDKTGTLTQNELTVKTIELADGRVIDVTGQGYAPQGKVTHEQRTMQRGDDDLLDALARAVVLCNEADLYRHGEDWSWRGDPTDIALLSLAHKLDWHRAAAEQHAPQINAIPFEPELRFAATFHRNDEAGRVFVKGAPERVLDMCALSDAQREVLHDRAVDLAGRGYRVLAIADGPAPANLQSSDVPPQPENLRLLGFVGMIDPLREGVVDAVERCHKAGISVAMVTGDHPLTARAISRELGLIGEDGDVVTGADLEALEEHELADVIKRSRVFARVAPRQKLDLVKAAQNSGEFVAVTGDGVNDAPALRAANIGVAMGRSGTDVARESADMVISDDNFATIVAGIEEGRIAYDNIRKVIYLLLSTGAAEVIMVTLAVLIGSPLPLLPAQLLWLNLVTNGIQHVALAFEPSEGDVLLRKPRSPTERIFNRVMIINVVFGAAAMGLLAFGVFQWLLSKGWPEEMARNALLLQMVLFENVHIGNCRSELKSPFHHSPLRSPFLLGAAVTALLVHVVMMYTPFGTTVLGAEPVSIQTWIGLAAVAVVMFWIVEAQKWLWRMRMSTVL